MSVILEVCLCCLENKLKSIWFWDILAGLRKKVKKEVIRMVCVGRMRPEVDMTPSLEGRGFPEGHRARSTWY